MKPPASVKFSDMSHAEARALLAAQHIGRIAYSLHDRVDIEPISYVCDGEWILMRTSEGSKTDTLRHHPWVAFQVDDIRSRSDWESVVVHGSIQHLSDEGPYAERALHAQAVNALRTLDPNAFRSSDLVPHRDHVLRLHIDNITARRATPVSDR